MRGDGTAGNYKGHTGLVPGHRRDGSCCSELHGGAIQSPDILPGRGFHRFNFGGVDIQDRVANTERKEIKMSAFLGTVWFMALVAAGGFVAGMMFKKPFLKLITGGRYVG